MPGCLHLARVERHGDSMQGLQPRFKALRHRQWTGLQHIDHGLEHCGSGAADKVLAQMDSVAEVDANKRGFASDMATQAIGGILDATQETLDFGALIKTS